MSLYNRFGFSTKKSDQHRPTNPNHQQPQFPNSASVKRTSSYGSVRQNVDFTPGFSSVKRNQPLAFGQDTASLRKLSTGKGPFGHGIRNGMPSTVKSATRAMPSSSMGFGSARKNSMGSKLFGATPQHSRASYMQQNRPSTSRLSRSSMGARGGKDNRPLSDQTFHRECQEKIWEFLNGVNYPHQLTKQNLIRPSMSDVSRIFEFLFSYFHEDVVIKNGANTSMEVVVPKLLAELGYPFQLKRSDLVSFSGGRQLGAILECICFVIGVISYFQDVDVSRLNKELDDFEEFSINNNIFAQIAEISLEHPDGDEIGEQTFSELKSLSEKFFGTEEQIQQMQNEHDKLQQNLKRMENEISIHIELPNKIWACKEENQEYDKYLTEISVKEEEYKKAACELIEELNTKEALYRKILEEENELQVQVDSQKDIIMEYRLSIERKNQIVEEIEKEEKQIQYLNEQILVTKLEENKQKAQNSSFINDLEDIITNFLNSIKSSKINQISPTFSKTFENDQEWKAIYARLKSYKGWDIENASDDLIREVKLFGQQFQNKFKYFKHTLLEQHQHSSAKGSASIEFICEKQELKALLEKKTQHLAEYEMELADFIAQKDVKEKEEAAKLMELQTEIDSARKQLIESEKENAVINDKLNNVKITTAELDKSIKVKRKHFMKDMAKRLEHDQSFLNKAELKQEALIQKLNSSVRACENKLHALSAYEKSH